MKAKREFLFFNVLFFSINVCLMALQSNLNILPSPQQTKMGEGYFKLINFHNYYSDIPIEKSAIIEELNFSLSGIGLAEIVKSNDQKNAELILQLNKFTESEAESINNMNEAYKLEISSRKILISAPSEKGLFYGMMTLIQLLERSENKLLQACTIFDFPDLQFRGISDDISRGQVSNMNNFKRIIRFIARYKMNTYMPYIEDVIEFDAYPSIGKGRGALSKLEVKELVDFASRYYVEVIPVFQTLGHYENILSLDEFVKYAEFTGASSLCVSDDNIYTFLETMLKEVFEQFPSKYFHMGADESYHVGMGRSKKLVEESSLAEVHAHHYKKVYDICKKYGKEVMMYGDIILSHPEILEMIPNDITIVDWHYGPSFNYPSTEKFKEAEFNYIVSPTVWNFISPYPFYGYAVPNIKFIAESGIKNNSIGLINSNWGDYGAETIKETVLPGYAWSAQCAWNLKESNFGDFFEDFTSDFLGTKIEEFYTVHEILSNQFNQMTWHDIWRHPLLDSREPSWWESKISNAVKYESINSSLRIIADNIEILKSKAHRNIEFADVLDLTKDFLNCYQMKLAAQKILHDSLEIEMKPGNIIQLIDQSINAFSDLRDKYQVVWLKYYKPANLNMVVDKFNRLISYFNETKEQVLSGKLESPLIKSKWIYCANDAKGYSSRAIFKYNFNLNSQVDSAKIQIIGNSFAKLTINNTFVDQVYARRSGSLWVDYKRVKLLDITGFLRSGDNEILIEVENYGPEAAAGVNILGEIYREGELIEIKSDESWIVKSDEDSNKWQNASADEYRFEITNPNFATNRTSWIER